MNGPLGIELCVVQRYFLSARVGRKDRKEKPLEDLANVSTAVIRKKATHRLQYLRYCLQVTVFVHGLCLPIMWILQDIRNDLRIYTMPLCYNHRRLPQAIR